MSRFGRHLENQMLRFPAQILPMMGFSSCDDSDVFQWPKLVSIGGSCSEPFSCLHQPASISSREGLTEILGIKPFLSRVTPTRIDLGVRFCYQCILPIFFKRSFILC